MERWKSKTRISTFPPPRMPAAQGKKKAVYTKRLTHPIPTVLRTVRIDLCPHFYEQTSATPTDCDPGSLLATLSDSKTEFQQLEYFCKGTLLKRMMKCGKAQCACRHDPAKRHGPYFEWTYKAKGKTVNVKLTPEVMPHVSRRFSTVSKTEVLAQSSRKTIAKCPAPSGQTGAIRRP